MIKFRAQYSQRGHPTPTAEFAAVVRKAVVKRRPRAYLVTVRLRQRDAPLP